MTTVILNDFESDRRNTMIFSGDDFAKMLEKWDTEDKSLIEYGKTMPMFEGRPRWCDLEPTHFRLMITGTLTKFSSLSTTDQLDPENNTFGSLGFLLTAFIHCLELRSECTIELMRVNRLNGNDVLFDYTASLNMHMDMPTPAKGLRVIVDNTQ